jgi:hypothetical protein
MEQPFYIHLRLYSETNSMRGHNIKALVRIIAYHVGVSFYSERAFYLETK